MKKIFLLFLIGVSAIRTNAQVVKETEVPTGIKTAFEKLYPTAKVDKWEKDKLNYEAEFKNDKTETSVVFGPNNNLLETGIVIEVSNLPKTVINYCKKKYPDQKIAQAEKITNYKGVITYEAEVNDMDVLFSADGTFIKASKK